MTMESLLTKTISSVQSSTYAFCRYITGNDTGKTGSHQAGFYIPKEAARLLFEQPVRRGENKDKYVDIKWQGDLITHSRFIYYGTGTRNEFRITRFGKDFPWLDDSHVGDLLVITQQSPEDYESWILSTDDDIDDFLIFYNLSPFDTNQLIEKRELVSPNDKLHKLLLSFTETQQAFPSTVTMAKIARDCYNEAFSLNSEMISKTPDDVLLKWVDSEYDLFQMMEHKIYIPIIGKPFDSVPAFVEIANEVLNRRKSRAGKSLEHHLAAVFDASKLVYEEQVVTEENKKPDFIFPNGKCYRNFTFPANLLVSLAAKTTCKDRWRQVINEANRIPDKHLFTLQPAISANQLKEMQDERVHLVVPRKFIHNYPTAYQSSILDLKMFISFVRDKQLTTPKQYLTVG